MISLFLLTCIAACLQLGIAQSRHYCYAFGNPHIVRFPLNAQEKGNIHDIWCKNTGLHWLVKNKYVAATIRIGEHPSSITDFNIVIYYDNGVIACTLNTNQFGITPPCADGTNMTYSKWEDGFSFNYIDAEVTVTITRRLSSGQYHYNIHIGQSMCMIKVSNGLCKIGCNRMNYEASQQPSQSLTNKTSLEIETAQKAPEICDIYMNNFLRQVPNSLTQTEIDNFRRSCIIDVIETGDAQAASGVINTLVVEITLRNMTSKQDLATKLTNDMIAIAAIANNSFVNSTTDVQQILNSGISSAVLRWSDREIANAACATSNKIYHSDPYLVVYALRETSLGCGYIYARSLLKLNQIDYIPIDKQIVSASLTLFGAQYNELVQISYQLEMSSSSSSEVFVQRVKTPWSSRTTYKTQPEITRINQAVIPATALRDGYNVTIDITKLVQDMRVEGNYGVQLILETEVYSRSMIFCSPTHPDVNRRPQITLVTR